MAALGIWVAVDFNSFWINFHYLFFDNDLWILSYRTDRMIRICPQQLFYDIVVKFGLIFLAAFGALLAAAIVGSPEQESRGALMLSVGAPPECPALRSLRSAPQKAPFQKERSPQATEDCLIPSAQRISSTQMQQQRNDAHEI